MNQIMLLIIINESIRERKKKVGKEGRNGERREGEGS